VVPPLEERERGGSQRQGEGLAEAVLDLADGPRLPAQLLVTAEVAEGEQIAVVLVERDPEARLAGRRQPAVHPDPTLLLARLSEGSVEDQPEHVQAGNRGHVLEGVAKVVGGALEVDQHLVLIELDVPPEPQIAVERELSQLGEVVEWEARALDAAPAAHLGHEREGRRRHVPERELAQVQWAGHLAVEVAPTRAHPQPRVLAGDAGPEQLGAQLEQVSGRRQVVAGLPVAAAPLRAQAPGVELQIDGGDAPPAVRALGGRAARVGPAQAEALVQLLPGEPALDGQCLPRHGLEPEPSPVDREVDRPPRREGACVDVDVAGPDDDPGRAEVARGCLDVQGALPQVELEEAMGVDQPALRPRPGGIDVDGQLERGGQPGEGQQQLAVVVDRQQAAVEHAPAQPKLEWPELLRIHLGSQGGSPGFGRSLELDRSLHLRRRLQLDRSLELDRSPTRSGGRHLGPDGRDESRRPEARATGSCRASARPLRGPRAQRSPRR
jgi:hypothetical protein